MATQLAASGSRWPDQYRLRGGGVRVGAPVGAMGLRGDGGPASMVMTGTATIPVRSAGPRRKGTRPVVGCRRRGRGLRWRMESRPGEGHAPRIGLVFQPAPS
jgi:hypothetical protein